MNDKELTDIKERISNGRPIRGFEIKAMLEHIHDLEELCNKYMSEREQLFQTIDLEKLTDAVEYFSNDCPTGNQYLIDRLHV